MHLIFLNSCTIPSQKHVLVDLDCSIVHVCNTSPIMLSSYYDKLLSILCHKTVYYIVVAVVVFSGKQVKLQDLLMTPHLQLKQEIHHKKIWVSATLN